MRSRAVCMFFSFAVACDRSSAVSTGETRGVLLDRNIPKRAAGRTGNLSAQDAALRPSHSRSLARRPFPYRRPCFDSFLLPKVVTNARENICRTPTRATLQRFTLSPRSTTLAIVLHELHFVYSQPRFSTGVCSLQPSTIPTMCASLVI